MRALFVGVMVLAGAGAAGLQLFGKSSYSSYSAQQLDVLEAAHRAQASDEGAFGLELLRRERWRRRLVPGLGGLGLVALVAAVLAPRRAPRVGADEAERFASAVGQPHLYLEGKRRKAAALLGVTPNAPREVVEAALEAQLRAKDPSRLDGLAPDLKALVRTQREELIQARDLLLQEPPSPTADLR